jgi:hypothetical protein
MEKSGNLQGRSSKAGPEACSLNSVVYVNRVILIKRFNFNPRSTGGKVHCGNGAEPKA